MQELPHSNHQPAFAEAVQSLAAADPDVARWHARFGTPSPWWRPPGFVSLARIIVEQQVSLASARAVFGRLETAAGKLSPARLLALSDAELAAAGLSRQKRRYLRAVAEACDEGRLDLVALANVEDAAARARLRAVIGIGPWTTEVYLLMAERRLNAWPSSDLGILAALGELKNLQHRPNGAEAERLGAAWQPYRGVAAWLLWHGYLRSRGLPTP